MAGGQPAEGSRRRAVRSWVEGERFPGSPLFLWTALLAALPLVLLSILSVWGVLAWGVTLTAVGVVLAVLLSLALTRLTVQWVVSRPLRESEQRYRTLVAQSFGLICTHDAQGVLQMVNPAGADRLGYTPEELVGTNLGGLLAPAVRGELPAYLERVWAGETSEGVMRVVTRQGEELSLFYRNHLVHEAGREPYVLGHAMDITERVRVEEVRRLHAEELAEVNRVLQAEIQGRALAESDRDRFFDISLELLCIAGFDGYFKQLNPAWEAILGWTLDELKAQPLTRLVHPDDLPSTRAEQQRLRMGGAVVDFENRYRTRDGSYRWLSWRAVPVPERELIYAVARDIEDQKQVEQMKTDFISVVSHELRTPLTSIRGALGLLAGGVAGKIPEKAHRLLDIAAKNSERLGRLIDDILDIEKIESGKMGFRFAPLELMLAVEQAVEFNQGYAQTHEAELRIVERLAGAKVWADPDRIQQVIANLLSNGCKFSPRGGTVEVAVSRRDSLLCVAVTDHGKGISPEFQGRIFQKFAQADTSSTRQMGGTGLGLNISRAIVERHGGSMGFESVPGVATTFFFELPEWTASWEGGLRGLTPTPISMPARRARPATPPALKLK